jgi:hypothetical protein
MSVVGSKFAVSDGHGKKYIVQAIQFTGVNFFQCAAFLGYGRDVMHNPELNPTDAPIVHTPFGALPVKPGDWIVRDWTQQLHMAMPADVFADNYKPVKE